MSGLHRDVLRAIGDTPLVELRKIAPANGCRLLLKIEAHNPTGEDAVAMSLRLARGEALFGGTSTGANVIAALRVAEELGPDATVVTLMCDSGIKYLSTELYRKHTRTGRVAGA